MWLFPVCKRCAALCEKDGAVLIVSGYLCGNESLEQNQRCCTEQCQVRRLGAPGCDGQRFSGACPRPARAKSAVLVLGRHAVARRGG